jgi:hypothetical protein
VSISVAGREWFLLELPKERLVVRYYDPQVKRWSIEDCVDVVRDGKRYTLYLRTSEQSYGQDRIVFDSIVKSFRFTRE